MAKGHGGTRKNSGRKPDWFRQLARDLLSEELGRHSRTRLQMVADMFEGKYTDAQGNVIQQTVVVGKGDDKKAIVIDINVDPQARLRAAELLGKWAGLDQLKLTLDDNDSETTPDSIRQLSRRLARRDGPGAAEGPSSPPKKTN